MTIDQIIAYEKIEAKMARKRAEEVQRMLNIPATQAAEEHEMIAECLTELKTYRENLPAIRELDKRDTALKILEMVQEIRKCHFYCMADLCTERKDCATCALQYIEKRIQEEYKCQQQV